MDDIVFANGNTIGNPHYLPHKVLENQAKIIKIYRKSIKFLLKIFLGIEIQRKNNSHLTEISQLKNLQNAMGNPCRPQEINGHKLQNKSLTVQILHLTV